MIRWRGAAGAGLVAMLVLGACGGGSSDPDAAAGRRSTAADQLEAVARESGAVLDRTELDPSGRYGRRYEGGLDRLCVIPDEEDGKGHYRIGAETLIGGGEYCRGAGTAKLSGDKLLMRFEGVGGCLIVARYEGDRLVMPGAIDVGCELLCTGRGSFAGASFPRIDQDAAAAREMRDAKKNLLCR